MGEDNMAMDFWERPPSYPIGLGHTADVAFEDLYRRLDGGLAGTQVSRNGWKSWEFETQDGTVCKVGWHTDPEQPSQ
jgi:hypothetical protein